MSQNILIWTRLHAGSQLPFTVRSSFAWLLHFPPKLIFKHRSCIYVVQNLKGTKEYRSLFLFLILNHPVPSSMPPIIHIITSSRDINAYILFFNFYIIHKLFLHIFHLVIYLGGISMLEDSFLILLNGCIVFQCINMP